MKGTLYKVLYCLVVFEEGGKEHVHCALEHEKIAFTGNGTEDMANVLSR